MALVTLMSPLTQIAQRKATAPNEALARIKSLTKRRDTMGDFEIQKDYRVVFENDDVEIREYELAMRSIDKKNCVTNTHSIDSAVKEQTRRS